jgi:probable biosynthetic protein (TIGR04098 family)
MIGPWREYRLTLGMPFLLSGRLSEVELLKHLGAFQWRSVAATAGLAENALCNEAGERLHFSMITTELGMDPTRGWEEFDEGTELFVQHRLGVFGKKLVEGLILWDRAPIPEEISSRVETPEALRAAGKPWAYLTHGFATRGAGTWAKLETPKSFASCALPELAERPQGIDRHLKVERTGTIPGAPTGAPLVALNPERIDYRVVPEGDLNALGQVYCARFPAILGHGERRFLRERLAHPLSAPLLECLSTEHRELYYFANARSEDSLQIDVRAQIIPGTVQAPAKVRIPFRVVFRSDLFRAADGVLMASACTRQVLKVPGHLKAVLSEAERFLARWTT